MIKAKHLLKDIEKLASEENSAVRATADQLGQIEDSGRWDYLAQNLLLAPREGVIPIIAADYGRWGCAVDSVSLLLQLLIYPSLIVDLRPYENEDVLVKSFGVTLNQLLRLADAGHILFNLYEFESQQRKGFETYLQSPSIEKILKHPNCRIHSIRRKEFFRSIAIPEDKIKNVRTSARELFENQIVNLAQQAPEQLESLTRCRDAEGAIEAIAEAYLYIEIFGGVRPEIRAWLDTLPKMINMPNLIQALVELRGIKSMLATPYTAAFGGFSTYTEQHVERMAKASWIFANQTKKKRVVDKTVEAGLRYIYGVFKQLNVTDDINTQVPSSVEDKDLDNFLEFLREHKELQNNAIGFLEQVRACVGDDQKTLSTLEGWAKAVAQVRREYHRVKRLATWVGEGVGGGAGYAVGVLTGGDSSLLNFVFATLGAAAGSSLAKKSEGFLQMKLLSQNKCQIIDRFNKFNQWGQL